MGCKTRAHQGVCHLKIFTGSPASLHFQSLVQLQNISSLQIVQLLLRNGADVTLRNYEGQTAVDVASLQVQRLLLDSVEKGGPHRTLLQAAWQGNARLVRKVLVRARLLSIRNRPFV